MAFKHILTIPREKKVNENTLDDYRKGLVDKIKLLSEVKMQAQHHLKQVKNVISLVLSIGE